MESRKKTWLSREVRGGYRGKRGYRDQGRQGRASGKGRGQGGKQGG